MNQEMHTWIATALTVLTVMGLDRKHFYTNENDFHGMIALSIKMGMTALFFIVWLYRIS
jgi:hypothetical protein